MQELRRLDEAHLSAAPGYPPSSFRLDPMCICEPGIETEQTLSFSYRGDRLSTDARLIVECPNAILGALVAVNGDIRPASVSGTILVVELAPLSPGTNVTVAWKVTLPLGVPHGTSFDMEARLVTLGHKTSTVATLYANSNPRIRASDCGVLLPDDLTVGTEATATVLVRNSGTANASRVQLLLRDSSTLTVGELPIIAEVRAGDQHTASFRFTPTAKSGSLQLGLVASDGLSLDLQPVPFLAHEGARLHIVPTFDSAYGPDGGERMLTAVLTNEGDAVAKRPVYLIDDDRYRIHFPDLQPGATVKRSIPVALPFIPPTRVFAALLVVDGTVARRDTLAIPVVASASIEGLSFSSSVTEIGPGDQLDAKLSFHTRGTIAIECLSITVSTGTSFRIIAAAINGTTVALRDGEPLVLRNLLPGVAVMLDLHLEVGASTVHAAALSAVLSWDDISSTVSTDVMKLVPQARVTTNREEHLFQIDDGTAFAPSPSRAPIIPVVIVEAAETQPASAAPTARWEPTAAQNAVAAPVDAPAPAHDDRTAIPPPTYDAVPTQVASPTPDVAPHGDTSAPSAEPSAVPPTEPPAPTESVASLTERYPWRYGALRLADPSPDMAATPIIVNRLYALMTLVHHHEQLLAALGDIGMAVPYPDCDEHRALCGELRTSAKLSGMFGEGAYKAIGALFEAYAQRFGRTSARDGLLALTESIARSPRRNDASDVFHSWARGLRDATAALPDDFPFSHEAFVSFGWGNNPDLSIRALRQNLR